MGLIADDQVGAVGKDHHREAQARGACRRLARALVRLPLELGHLQAHLTLEGRWGFAASPGGRYLLPVGGGVGCRKQHRQR